jgi:two-component system LytT family sensor kinase
MKSRFNDIWLRIIGIPLLALLGEVISNYQEVMLNKNLSSYSFYYFLILCFFIGLIWHLNLLIHFKVRKYYERFNDNKKLIKGWIVRLILYGANTIVIIFVAALIFNYREKNFTLFFFRFLQPLSFALLFSYLVAGFYETRYFIYEWSKSVSEAEDLKKLNLQIQVDSLKNQINPHFLFNSLNTLSSLVNTDRAKAEKFIDEMSNIYRYVLQNNEKDFITLEDELKFIHSFVDLLRTRYEHAIEVDFSVDDICLSYLLPPLTLQLLVENAVKHNVVSISKPLKIRIFTDESRQLVIENNSQPKTTSVRSNKLGLTNIFTKYRLLNQAPVVVNHTDSTFQVILPLFPALIQTNNNHLH